MSMMKLAYMNFKNSLKSYLSLIVSLAFTILIFLNFQNIVYSNSLDVLGERSKDNIIIIVQAITVVLICFMFFFIWYSTNVFLTKRKKEIGIYVFMGLTNQKIGKLYMIETTMIGFLALILGLGFGLALTWLFQMVLLAISDIAVKIEFQLSWQPIAVAACTYLAVYMIFVLKGYVNIVRSSVLNMVLATKKNEYVKQNSVILAFKSVLGVCVLGAGYFLAIKEGGQEVMGNVLAAVVLVIAGIYLLFGGVIPMVTQSLAKRKKFLYKKQRNLWVNNLIFRMKKNYRTYAIVCVLMLCSVTALATGVAMKNRYEGIVHFRSTYTYQLISNDADEKEKMDEVIERNSDIKYSTKIPILYLDGSLFKTAYKNNTYAILSWSDVKQAAEDAGLKLDIKEPKDDEIIDVSKMYLLSLYTEKSGIRVTINGKEYRQIDDTNEPYLGYLQEQISFYLVNDHEFERLCPLGTMSYTYNYKISDMDSFEQTKAKLDDLVKTKQENGEDIGRIAVDMRSNDIEWVKVLYTICIFMFLVFVLAGGSILFMKLYNDAFEEKERYQVLKKLGIDRKTLKKSIANELKFAYVGPLIVMTVSSWFSVHALAKMMSTELLSVNIISVLVIYAIFFVCYLLSVSVYQKNAGVKQ